MNSVETALLRIERDALAAWRIRLTAAEDLLALVNEELDDMQAMVDRIGQPL